MSVKRKWDMASDEVQRKCINEVIARIEDIQDTSTVGVIAAQEIIDIITENLAPAIYNKGIYDTKKILEQKFQDIQVDLDALEQRN